MSAASDDDDDDDDDDNDDDDDAGVGGGGGDVSSSRARTRWVAGSSPSASRRGDIFVEIYMRTLRN